jgi:copper chaperone
MVTISIPNMICGGCAKGVLATLRQAAPGVEVTVNLDLREISIAVSEAAPLVSALGADGWQAEARG